MSQEQLPRILMIMLCMHCMTGGAEKRYARVFKMLSEQPGARHKLLINRSMLEPLTAAGIFSEADEGNMMVLDPPFRRYFGLSGRPNPSQGWMFRLIHLIAKSLDVCWYVWKCWYAIRQYRPAIVHPLLTGMYLSLPALLLQPRIRHVMSAYSYIFEPDAYTHDKLGAKVGSGIKRFAMQRCHMIDALSESIFENLIRLGIEPGKIRTAPCSFTDISLCQPASRRKKWVVYLARFIEFKNPLLLAEAVPKVMAKVPDVHFYFLGWGELQAQLETVVQEAGISDVVTIRYEARPLQFLNQSSIFVSLQAVENYPSQSLIEAMACGNAIVATDVGETWRLVDESNGLRVSPSAEAVAAAIIDLLQNPDLFRLGSASRQRILQDYTPERFFNYITGVYRAAASVPYGSYREGIRFNR